MPSLFYTAYIVSYLNYIFNNFNLSLLSFLINNSNKISKQNEALALVIVAQITSRSPCYEILAPCLSK